MDPREFLDRENWLGSFYELAIEVAPYGDDARLLTAQQALWRAPSLDGPYLAPYESPDVAFRPVSLPTTIGPEDTRHLHGVLHLPGDRSLGCKSVIVREPDRSDWLIFCVPTGMLGLVFPHIVYPLERTANPWLDEVDHTFLALAGAVYAVAPFNLALVDEEVSGTYSAGEINTRSLPKCGCLVSPDVVAQLQPDLQPDLQSVVLPSGLHWFPPH
jgi:hypothetical protein